MIVTREQVKLILQIAGDEQDALIDTLIPLVEEDYEEIRNLPFEVDDYGDILFPKGAELTAALMVGYHLQAARNASGMESESLGDYSYSRGQMAADYPHTIVGRIRRYVGTK